jgi:hypothetical protein
MVELVIIQGEIAKGLGLARGRVSAHADPTVTSKSASKTVYSETTVSMFTRCNQCGYENGPNYRFCGMCGAPLESVPATKTVAAGHPGADTKPAPVSGPSFLGLAEEPPRDDLEYLLQDDEPRSSHWRLYLALIILVVAALLIWARWRRDGYPWSSQTTTASSAPVAESAPPSPATEQPPAPSPQQQQEQKPVPLPTESSPAQGQQPAAAGQQPAPTETNIPAATAPTPSPEEQSSAPAESESNAPEAAPPTPAPKPTPKETAKPAPTVPAVPAISADDRLAAEGEKYLYGNGVSADCGRAVKSLNTAANHSNAKAQSLLGAMYATGHCASRDLPTAYRWFARALHNDPSNVRLERDLQMVWNQMTPGERSLATRSGQ